MINPNRLAKNVPRCQVPSIMISTLPLYLQGISSSIHAKTAVYSPPTANPVTNFQNKNPINVD